MVVVLLMLLEYSCQLLFFNHEFVEYGVVVDQVFAL
jgi:hypothetical protein